MLTSAEPAFSQDPSRGRAPEGLLVCADGSRFRGEIHGAERVVSGELVFNTVMTGYQEVISDPSYSGQVVAFTSSHIGNYGVHPADSESSVPRCRAAVVRELSIRPSSWRSQESLQSWLSRYGVPLISGVDTRRLTRLVREAGAIPCAVGPLEGPFAASEADIEAAALAETGTTGVDLVSSVSTKEPYFLGDGPLRILVMDFGVKASILASLASLARVEVLPASTPASEVLARQADGVVLSNGPGDPAALSWAVQTVEKLIGEVPTLGICLGHQLLAQAIGGSTFKLPFGHHGGNHPVRRASDGGVEITSQNHNYAVAPDSLRGARVTHVNLNDHVIEGFCVDGQRVWGLQYHPEAGPGPHDSRAAFADFVSDISNAPARWGRI